MSPSLPVSRAERMAPWAVGVLFALPVLIAKYPPMSDLPLHEASVGLLRHWGDARFAPPTLYALNLGHANQLFSLLVFGLSYVVPVAWASKLIVAGSLFLLPLAAAHFADHVGASRWTALLAAPVGMGWLFFWGLVQNMLGLVALLWLLPAIDRFAIRPTWRGVALMCEAMVLLHFAHQAMQSVACIAIALCSLGLPLRTKATVLRALPAAFCVALGYAANEYAWHMAGPRHVRTPPFVLHSFFHKILSVPGVVFGGYEPYVRNLLMILAAGAIALLAAARFRQSASPPQTLGARLHSWRFELLALLLFAIYLAAPANVRSTTLVYHRFLPPAWAIFVVCAGIGSRAAVRLPARALCAAVPIGTVLVAWPSFADSHRAYASLESLVDHIEVGSAVAVLHFGPDPQYRLWSPLVAEGHVVALRGGRALFDYSQSPISPVTQRAEKQWAEPLDRFEGHPAQFRPDWDFTRFRYLLFISANPSLAYAVSLAFQNDARLIAQSGDWYLFESLLPVVPIDADDAPLPNPHPPTLGKRLKEVVGELLQAEEQSGGQAQ
ncbi:MAG TPA: hypothetical protein VGY54_26840 [Polyangiaceae bacterium]|nr:hypothetical protein [Polyangiaceae bacterium]